MLRPAHTTPVHAARPRWRYLRWMLLVAGCGGGVVTDPSGAAPGQRPPDPPPPAAGVGVIEGFEITDARRSVAADRVCRAASEVGAPLLKGRYRYRNVRLASTRDRQVDFSVIAFTYCPTGNCPGERFIYPEEFLVAWSWADSATRAGQWVVNELAPFDASPTTAVRVEGTETAGIVSFEVCSRRSGYVQLQGRVRAALDSAGVAMRHEGALWQNFRFPVTAEWQR